MTMSMRRIAARTALALVALYSVALAFIAVAMRQPPERFAGAMKYAGPVPFLLFPFETLWKSARAGRIHPGDSAPDFTLPVLDGQGNVTLSSFRGKRPVVLVFGSYT